MSTGYGVTIMAYDASFLTGSNSTAVEPISTGYLHNDQEVSDLENTHMVIKLADDNLSVALESFDQMVNVGGLLHQNVKRGEHLSNAMYRILNMELKQNSKRTGAGYDTLPAMESLDNIHPRDLTIAMENVVTDTIKSVWDKIKNMFLNLHNQIKTWYIKAWDGSVKLKNQAEAIKAKASATTSSPRENNFEMNGLKHLNLSGKVPQPQDIAKGVAEISKITGNLLTTNAETYTKLFPSFEKLLKETIDQAKGMKDSDASTKPEQTAQNQPQSISEAFGKDTTDAAGQTVVGSGEQNKLIMGILSEWGATAKAVGIDTGGEPIRNDTRWDSEKVFAYRNPIDLLGAIMLVAVFPVNPATTVESYADFKNGFKIGPEPIEAQPKEFDDKATFNTAPTAVVINICENVISSCDVFLKYKLLYEARDKATGNLMKQMEQYVSSNSNLKGTGQRHMSNSISTTVNCVKKMQDGETRWSKYAMSVLNKAIVYCRTSLSQY